MSTSMRRKRAAQVMLAVAVTAVSISGCAKAQTPGAQVTGTSQHVERSWARSYSSLDAVAAEATFSVQVRIASGDPQVVPADADGDNTFQSLVYTASVLDVLGGTSPSDTLLIRTDDTRANSPFDDQESAKLAPDSEYVLFLKPFEFTSGDPTGQYTIVGDLAAYQVNSTGQATITSPKHRDALPRTTSIATLKRAAARIK